MTDGGTRVCYYPGSFDIVTYGHMDIIEQAHRQYDAVIVAVARNSGKTPMFDATARQEMVEAVVREYDLHRITVIQSEGLTADRAMEFGAIAVIRGIRLMTDFEYELNYAMNNRIIQPDLDTVWYPSRQEHLHISSTVVKEIIKYRRFDKLDQYVPASVAQIIRERSHTDRNVVSDLGMDT